MSVRWWLNAKFSINWAVADSAVAALRFVIETVAAAHEIIDISSYMTALFHPTESSLDSVTAGKSCQNVDFKSLVEQITQR